uniref:Bromodomain adjacent to zinc finger domain protein 2B-like n=1 Tax=Sinocyclocheilus anshuiensis TaxID=1608454 RepID=A0A671PB84_9TELE
MESAERLVTPRAALVMFFDFSLSGHLFQMVGNQGLGIASFSGAFPMIHHPVFSLHSSSPVRSEFGGLGTLGMSAALAARSQLGAVPGINCISLSRQSSLPQAFPPPLRGAQESQSSQKHPFNNPFLPSLPTENHHPGAVQDAPLALITKPRSQSTRAPDKPLLAATSPAFNIPINLTSTGRTSTSPGLTPRAARGKGCQIGRRTLKRERPSLVEHFRGSESELPDSKDSDDLLMEDEDENVASNDSLSGHLEHEMKTLSVLRWQRETRITNMSGRLRGEVVYYAPCGRKLRQYPDVIKGLQWCLLKEEEVVPRILAMEGRRGRLKNLDALGNRATDSARSRRKARAPDEGEADALSTSEAKLLRRLEAQEIARQAAQMKLRRKLEKQALAQAAKEARRQQAIMAAEERRKHKEQMKILKQQVRNIHEKERLKQEKRDEKRLNKERKLEPRRLELEMAKELNKPNEDMCLSDHKPLPALSRIAGLLLPGGCFSDCLMVMQFLRCFGKVLGFDLSADVPSLGVLQAGLLNVGDSMGFIQDLLVRMLSAAVCDPGLPAGHRAKTALGDHVTNLGLNRDNVSEVLQFYMEAHCGQTELEPLAESLKTKAFQAHTPSQKASILAFLVNELSCSKSVVSEIDKNIDNMTNLRREKWVIEGNLRKLRSIYAKRTGKRESSVGGEEAQFAGASVNSRKRKRKGGESDEDDEEDDDSDEQGEEDEDEDDFCGKKGKKAEACEDEQQTQIRRKLFEASHSLRSVMFGQDRYKRRYWVLPQCGGIFVEGLESGEGPEELQRERERMKNAHLVQVKEEPTEEPDEKCGTAETKPPQDVDSLNLFLQSPDSFSKLSKLLEVAKMSSEVSCHQYNSPKQQTTLPRSPNHDVKPDLHNTTYLTNAQQQIRNEQLYKVLTERNTHWFSLLPRSPCDVSSLTEGPHSASSSSPQTTAVSAGPYSAAGINNFSLAALQMRSGVPMIDLPFCVWSSGNLSPDMMFSGVSMAQILSGVHPSSEGSGNLNDSKSDSPESPAEKPLSTPSPVIEVHKNQDYPSPQPIPEEMLTGWWKVTDIEELRSIEKACHSRGIREKQLQKQLQKHMDYIGQVCSRNRDVSVIDVSELEENQVSEDTVQSWCVEEQAMDMDIGVLQQVEELEHKVSSSSLQVKGWMHPVPQSQSEDLVYYEHKPVMENCEDRSDCGIVRRANNPLDIAVTRLAELERNIERRAEEDLAPGLKQWRKALGEVRSASQLSLCIQQLHKSIAWEKSIMKVYCQICCKGDNEELLLLCDGCDRGCHTYCHKPKITTIPDGDWFCPACISQASSQSLKTKKPLDRSSGGLKKPAEAKRHKKPSVAGDSEDDSGSANSTPRKVLKEIKKRKTEENPSTNPAKQESPKTARDDSKDLAMCRILLAELESHQDAGPFLTPVNPKSVPGYRKIIKKPMDLSTIRDKLTNSQWVSLIINRAGRLKLDFKHFGDICIDGDNNNNNFYFIYQTVIVVK